MNAGSYYDKINTAMLFTESIDNFISTSRSDLVDARYRAVSLADLARARAASRSFLLLVHQRIHES